MTLKGVLVRPTPFKVSLDRGEDLYGDVGRRAK